MRLCSLVFAVLHMCIFVQSGDPVGHMQPLGSHMPAIEVEVRQDVPDPIEFFSKYIKPGKPLVMKGAAKKFRNYKTWNDDEYLKKTYGNWLPMVDVGKYDGNLYGKSIQVPFRYFIERYNEKEYYIITDIVPDNPMRKEMTLPKAMACGGYAELTYEALLLFSSGSTQSALHWDGVDNMHCVLDGTKEWYMYDRVLRDRMPIMHNNSDYAAIDCRKVDMVKYPVFQELPFHHASLEKGDCLFVPYYWPHHVRTDGKQRSMAQAIWFGPVHHPNTSDCPKDLSQLPDTVPLGRRRISHLAHIRNAILMGFGSAESLSKETFLSESGNMNSTAALRAYNALDQDRDGYITWKEVENLDKEIEIFSEIIPLRKLLPYEEREYGGTSHKEL